MKQFSFIDKTVIMGLQFTLPLLFLSEKKQHL